METELVLVREVDEKMRQGWKLHGPPILDGEHRWKQTIIQRYPDAYTSALMISTKKLTSIFDIEWLFQKIAEYFQRAFNYLLTGACKDGKVEPLMAVAGWPSFIPKFSLENLCVLSLSFVMIFVVNPIMYGIRFGASLGPIIKAQMILNVKFILLAFRVFLKLSYLHVRELEGLHLSQIDVYGIEFTGVQFEYADLILTRVQNMAKINGVFVNGDIPGEVKDRVKYLFQSVLGDNRPEMTQALWILLQY